MPATTAEALQAKTRIMPAMIDNCDRSLEDEDEAL
jgi:hypothetical protein